MQVSKKIPFDDPIVLNGVRALYLVSNLIMFAVYYYIGMQIKKKKGEWAGALRWARVLRMSLANMDTDLTTLKYLEPAAAGSGEEPKLVTSEYKLVRSALVLD